MVSLIPQVILFLAANPKDTSRLRLDQELRDIGEGLQRAQKRDQFNLEQRLAVRPRDIQRAMLDVTPQIVHFAGHGSGESGLVFEDEIGNTKLIDGTALAGLFGLFADQIQCVVLNGCYSEVQAQAITQYVPYVIGMNQAVGNKAAIAFAVGFYDALGAGRDVEFAYKLGCAAIRLEGITENLKPVLLKQSTVRAAIAQPKSTIVWKFVLAGTLNDVDQVKSEKIIEYLRKLSGDTSLTLSKVEQGSIVLMLEGSEEGFKVIESLFKAGQLNEVLGLPVIFIGHELTASTPQSLALSTPIEVFISYSHKDEDLKDELYIHLANLTRQNKIKPWQDRAIEAGTEWDTEIQARLESAGVILLLITPRFIASEYCFDKEMQRAMERHSAGRARVIPIVMKPCDWQGTPFSKLQVLPKDAKPVTSWNDKDEALLNVVQGIRKAVDSLVKT